MLRKRARLLIAYSMLATGSATIISYDAFTRWDSSATTGRKSKPQPPGIDNPTAITPLAESPFPSTSRVGGFAQSVPETHQAPGTAGRGKKHNAPVGTFFLRVAVQTDTNTGPRSFPAGTPVQVLHRQGGKVKVSRDGSGFFVRDWQITNDSQAARPLARSSS